MSTTSNLTPPTPHRRARHRDDRLDSVTATSLTGGARPQHRRAAGRVEDPAWTTTLLPVVGGQS